MVAIMTGAGLGLLRGSGSVIGSGGLLGQSLLGRAGDNVYVNAASGNLVIQNADEILLGVGADDRLTRTYNSLGSFNDPFGTNQGWAESASRGISALSGAANSAGSSVTLTDWDGSDVTFHYDASANGGSGGYTAKEDGGALALLTYNAASGSWTYRNGDRTFSETFDATSGGRIVSSADNSGNALSFSYDPATGLLNKITTQDGESTSFSYNGSRQLTSIVTSRHADNLPTSPLTQLTRVYYSYDSAGRLSTVTVDLSPQDNSTADNNVYTTTYGYDGSSNRIASISQTDGSSLAIGYTLVGGNYRVTSLIQTASTGVTRKTSISYDIANLVTTITDPQQNATSLSYDSTGRLLKITAPPALSGGPPQVAQFSYDSVGNLLTIAAPDGSTITRTYDSNGNVLREQDALGNVVTRTFGANNQLLTETRSIASNSAATTRYVYDSANHLRFVIAPEGDVTEFRYSPSGQRVSTLKYSADSYNVSGLGTTDTPTEATMAAWASNIADKTTIVRTDTAYDFRGNVSSTTSYGHTLSSGAGDTTSDVTSTTFVYDQFGNLLQRQPGGQPGNGTASETFVYDGLGRAISSTDLGGAVTRVSFNDSQSTTVVTLANGMTETSVYDLAGELISYTQASGSLSSTTNYQYDSLGHLRAVTDPDGQKSYALYDNEGRKTADIQADGTVTEYVYNAANLVVETIHYNGKLSAAQLGSLTDAGGNPANVSIASIRPASDPANDRYQWNVYDGDHRLAETIDASGAVTAYSYDGESRLVATIKYANRLDAATLAGFKSSPPLASVVPATDPINDRVERVFYDGDNRLLGTLDGEGDLTRVVYDSAGRKIQTIAYASAVQAGLRLSGAFSDLVANVTTTTNPNDIHNWFVYDQRGLLRAMIDGEGDLVRYHYDALGNLDQKVTGQKLDPASLIANAPTLSNLPAPPASGLETTNYTNNLYGQVLTETLSVGGVNRVTVNSYDGLRRLVSTTVAQGTADASTETVRYDGLGRVIGRLGGVGSAALAALGANPTDAQVNAVYAAYGTNYVYDSADRLISKSTPDGSAASGLQTLYYYDADGRLIYAIDPLGAVTEYRYDTFGERSDTIVHAVALSSAALAGLSGGLVNANVTATVSAIANASTDSDSHTDYDQLGQAADSKDPAGATTAFTYDAFGDVATITAPFAGSTTVQTSRTYDRRGLLLTSSSDSGPGGLRLGITNVYDAFGRAISTTDAANRVRATSYDRAGRVIRTQVDPNGQNLATNYFYDANGNLTATTDPTGQSSRYVYDESNRLIYSVDSSGDVVATAYDNQGRIASTRRYVAAIAASTLAAFGTRISAGDITSNIAASAADFVTSFSYDQDGDLLQQTVRNPAATDLVTTNTYDKRGLLVASTDAAGEVTRYVYDGDGRQIFAVDGAGDVAATTFDSSGRVLSKRIYASVIAANVLATLPRQLAPGDIGNNIATSAGDEVTNYVYDLDGRLRYKIDAGGRVCEYAYDQAGNLIRQVEYSKPIASSSTYSLSSVAGALVAAPDDRVTRTIYDALNRPAFAIDAEGGVTAYSYDRGGNLVKTLHYAALFTVAGDQSLSAMQSWATANPNPLDRVSRSVFDSAGRQVYSVDGEGYVSEYRYDLAGRLITEIKYAGAYAVTDAVTQASLQAQLPTTIPSDAQVLRFDYDPMGRVANSYDGAGVVTHYAYDGEGRVTDVTVAYNKPEAATTHTAYDAAGRVSAVTRGYGAHEATTTTYQYDGVGRVRTVTDGLGHTTSYAYDLAGRTITKTVQLDASTNAVTLNQYDAFGNLVKVTDPNGNIGYFYYDGLNRQVLQIDPSGYATATAYSRGDQAISVTHYVTATTGAAVGAPPMLTTNPKDAVTSFGRDRLDRLTSITDAEGYSEIYVLNAFGDRVQVTNKLGGVTVNSFDHRGLLKSETLPITSYRPDGSVESGSVINTYSYDARGNRTTKVEASGLAEQRTTVYRYDLVDRLYQTVGDQVQVLPSNMLSGATGSNVPLSSSPSAPTTATPVETRIYDARGNVIEIDDANGGRSFAWYDTLGRKIADLDAAGTLRTWSYDADSNARVARVYGDPVKAPANPGGSPPSPVNSNNYRETDSQYDFANRLTSSSSGTVLTGSWNGSSYSTASVQLTTSYSYDAMGNLVRQTDPNGNNSYSWYDKRGKKIGQLDAAGYLTRYDLDQDGNVLTETRFATAYKGAVSLTSLPSVPSSSDDRITVFTYDRNGRRVTETRSNLVSFSVGSSGAMSQNSSNSAIVTYSYNGLGEVTRKTEATGDYTDYAYDQDGRLVLQKTSPFAEFSANAQVQRQTHNYYDGLNNLVRTRVGAASGDASSDHITLYNYGAGGRLSSTVDAAGFGKSYFYDANGNTVATMYGRLHSDGTTSTEAQIFSYDGAGRSISQGIATFNGTAWVVGDRTQVTYDAYGEIVSRGLDGGAQESFAYDNAGRLWRSTQGDGIAKLYLDDANGNQTLAITSAGASLASYSSIAAAVAAFTGNGAHSIDSVAISGVDLAISLFDARNKAIETRLPFRELSTDPNTHVTTTALIDTRQTYNAFGEVTSQTDARGNVTSFAYNTIGKIVRKTSPQTNVTDESGATTRSAPVELDYYDASGRLVGVTDANNNSTFRQLLAGSGYGGSDAVVIAEFHADGGIKRTGVDVFGDARRQINELGFVTGLTYDGMDRVIEVDHVVRADGTSLSDYYTYDNVGQRVDHYNNQFFDPVHQAAQLEKTDYDAQGRIISQVDFAGRTTSYSYSYNAALATTGLGTFGGWTKTTTNTSGLTSTDSTDYFNRIVARTDFGGHSYNYSFDLAGRLTQMTSSAGANMGYTYFNTGQLATASDLSDWGTGTPPANQVSDIDAKRSRYAYDVNGNRVAETITREDKGYTSKKVVTTITKPKSTGGRHLTSGGSTVTSTTTVQYNSFDNFVSYEAATASYDELNRMTAFSDTGMNGTSPANTTYEYDAVGNKRHVVSTYTDLTTNAATTQDYWFRYDSLNRFVVTQGQLSGTRGATGTTIIAGATGITVSWDKASERMTAAGPTDSELYAYTNDGYLRQVSTTNGASTTLRVSEIADLLGRVVSHTEYTAAGAVAYSRTANYDNVGNVTSDSVSTLQSDGSMISQNSSYAYTAADANGGYTGAYQGGAVTHKTTLVYKNGVYQRSADTKNLYVWWDGVKQSEIDYKPDTTQNVTNVSTFNYDKNGSLTEVIIRDGNPRQENYTNDLFGKVIDRTETNIKTTTDPHEHYYYFNGNRVGDNGNNGPSNTDYSTAIGQRSLQPSSSNDFTLGYASPFADFSQAYVPVDPNTDLSTGSTYVSGGGETLASVAQAAWGDSSLWYLIADANGLNGSETLVAGQTLVIPNKVTNVHSNSTTFEPYNPNQMLGDVQPTTPVQVAHKQGCGIVGQILLTVISVAVTVLTAGTVGPVAAAVLGSVVSQGIGVATGIQDHFSWSAVGLAAIGGEVGGILGPGGEAAGDAANGFVQIAESVAQAAETNLITQGIGVATGLQNRFDWASVGAAAAAAGATAAVSSGLNDLEDSGNGITRNEAQINQLVSGIAGTIASAAARSLIDGSDFGDNLVGGLANFAGETIGNKIASEVPKLATDWAGATNDEASNGAAGPVPAAQSNSSTPDAAAAMAAVNVLDPKVLDALTEWHGTLPLLSSAPVEVAPADTDFSVSLAPYPIDDRVYSPRSGDTVEALSRQFNGENWLAGVGAIVQANGLKTNIKGSPLIYPGIDIVIPGLDHIDTTSAAKAGGEIIANNSQGLAETGVVIWPSDMKDSMTISPPYGPTVPCEVNSSSYELNLPGHSMSATPWWDQGVTGAIRRRQWDADLTQNNALSNLELGSSIGLDNPGGQAFGLLGALQLTGSAVQFWGSPVTGLLDQAGAWSHDRPMPVDVDRKSTDFVVNMASLFGGEVSLVSNSAAIPGLLDKLAYEQYWTDLATEPGTLSNTTARAWYMSQNESIPELIDRSLPLEQQAKQAFELRNAFRTEARNLMADPEAAKLLDQESPNMTWDQIVAKYSSDYSGDALWQKILDSAPKSRQSLNQSMSFK